MKKSLLPFVLFLVFLGLEPSFGKEPVKIRVAVLKDKMEVTLSVTGSFEIVDARTELSLYRGRNFLGMKITPSEGGIKVRNTVYNTNAIIFISKKKAAISVNNRSYRGDISVYKDASGKLLVVNTLDLESYLKGVLYHEISHKWPIDAIKAQAVASRTYALYQKGVMRPKDYDVAADTSSQVYGGYSSEKHKTNRAVNFTSGEVLTYNGKLFPAYFHATCGGATEDAGELWKIDMIPLKGGRACSFCSDSPHYYWKAELGLKTIIKKLGERYQSKEGLINISIIERTGTGRVRTLELKDAVGKSIIISAKDFRSLLGSDLIRSTNFSIVIEQGHVIFSGKGWGHGVGLCQWGAYGMSNKGYNYKQILDFYYPGAEIVQLS
ncbi:MAG: cell division protein [Candidatus Omnitrophica bacterium CG_4_10_14_0_8_um_filter_44_12]|nr:MAG: cell division protein [Candidatus Omnitrophica bacterium CG_4_10_14_0_8_um_filter_44_12]